MNTSLLFDVDYCNQLLDEMVETFHESIYAKTHLQMEPVSPRLWCKKYIQLTQIHVALEQIIQTPHMKQCIQSLRVLGEPYLEDSAFVDEINSFFTSDYGKNYARNYAISLKHYIEVVQQYTSECMELKETIFSKDVQEWKVKEVAAFSQKTKRLIKAFLKAKEKAFTEVFNRLEVYVESQRFHKVVSLLESE